MKNKEIIIVIAFVVLAIVAIIFTANVKKKEKALEAENARMVQVEEEYQTCLSDEWLAYSSNWDGQCEVNGKKADCNLPFAQANILEDRLDASKKTCLEIYKIKMK